MFSPYYAHARHARRRAGDSVDADPLEHSTLNVALYGRGPRRWAMTERRRAAVVRDATHLAIGPSSLEWIDAGTLRLHLDEVGAPLPRRVRGTIDVVTGPRPVHRVDLDTHRHHQWGVIAPQARITVALDAPKLSWTGAAYLDSNRGSVPLEQDFVRWNWSRCHFKDGATAVVYDVERRVGEPLAIADRFDVDGRVERFAAPPITPLPTTLWGLARATRCDAFATPTVSSSMEDGPFYSRAVVDTRWLGEPVTGVHEFLSLERFERRWVRAMLPFRMPRRL